MQTGALKKHIYFENLDGLRFLCFLSVFFYHSFHTVFAELKDNSVYHLVKYDIFGNGNIGVNFFFVLSGFLITYLLIEEKKLNGQINLKNFWIRRVLRIWPLFYFCVFFGFVCFPFIKSLFGQVPLETASPLAYLTFTNNFDLIRNGLPDSSVLGVLWSVAIEEQFYLLWPLIVFIFPVRKLWIPFAAVIGGSLVFRAISDTAVMHEFHTLSCIGDMTVGALGAWLILVSGNFKSFIRQLPKLQTGILYAIFIGIFLFRDELFLANSGIRIFERLIIACVIILIILEQSFSAGSIFKMSSFKTISKLGIITYGLYCLHFIGILIATTLTQKLAISHNLWTVLLLDTAVALLVTIIISKISYRFFEMPFLKLKERFAFITR